MWYLWNLAKLFPAGLPLVGAWRRPYPRAEGGGEVALVGKAQSLAHVRDPAPGVGQEVFGPLHPLPQQMLMRAQPGALLEQPTEVLGAHLRHRGERRERQLLGQVGLHILEHAPQAGLRQPALIGGQRRGTDRVVLQQMDR
jgi:hypothetical protein